MAKRVIQTARIVDENKFGPDKVNYLVLCDDNTTYHWQKFEDAPNWTLRGRWEGSEYHTHNGRLPTYVECHMEGFTARNGGAYVA